MKTHTSSPKMDWRWTKARGRFGKTPCRYPQNLFATLGSMSNQKYLRDMFIFLGWSLQLLFKKDFIVTCVYLKGYR
jgi:hypothetical protein